MTRHRPLWYLVKASTRWLQESCFEHCNFTGAHHYKHNVGGRRRPPPPPAATDRPPAARHHQMNGFHTQFNARWIDSTHLQSTSTFPFAWEYLITARVLQLSKPFLEMTRWCDVMWWWCDFTRKNLHVCILAAGSVAIYGRFFSSNRKGEVLKLGQLTICFHINIFRNYRRGGSRKQK